MVGTILEQLFVHNNWANLQIIQVCSTLTDEQLDAPPQSATFGSIRRTLIHLAGSQLGYLQTLTLPLEARLVPRSVPYDELEESVRSSGEALIQLARNAANLSPTVQVQTWDGYLVETGVLMTQVINHATEHREQIKSMLTALGITAPGIDGWDYGFATNTLIKIKA